MRPRRIYLSAPSTIVGANFHAARELITRRLTELDWDIDEFFVSGRVADGTKWTFENASQLMRTCQGAVILALPRRIVSEGGGSYPAASEFNHFEGGLAVAHGASGGGSRGGTWRWRATARAMASGSEPSRSGRFPLSHRDAMLSRPVARRSRRAAGPKPGGPAACPDFQAPSA
jgi:hypothetical protein